MDENNVVAQSREHRSAPLVLIPALSHFLLRNRAPELAAAVPHSARA